MGKDKEFMVQEDQQNVSKFAEQVCDAITQDKDLSEIASQLTHLGLHTIWLGQEIEHKKMKEVGEHLYKMGGNLQALAIIRMDRMNKG